MPVPKELTSLDNPRINAVVRLREQRERRRTGLFVAEGSREIERALAAGLKVLELYVCPEMVGAAEARSAPPASAAPTISGVFHVTPSLMRKMAYCENPEGVLAVFEQPRWRLEDLHGADNDLWLVAVGIQKPGNLGAMMRSAEAAGAAGVLVADAVVDAFNPNAIRASTGAVFTLPVVGAPGSEVRRFLAERGVKLLATTPGASTAYTDIDLTGPVAVIIGAEDAGLDRAWLDASLPIAIPMSGRTVDSLNASVAAAVVLFEAVRQRRGAKD